MRQGEVAPKGNWAGNPLGGVKAPQAIILPDPATRFARTAARLETLADGHAMEGWLLFMARLSAAQHRAAMESGPLDAPPDALMARAAEARLAPLAVETYPRRPAWRDMLGALLEALGQDEMPAEAARIAAAVRRGTAGTLEGLADRFLAASVAETDLGATLYVAAALQVYFVRLAAALPAASPRLLPDRGLCPCCGSTPVAGLVTGSGSTPGARYLHCSLCAASWNHVRAVCVTCGGSRSLSLKGVEGDPGLVKAETCDECRTYTKLLYQAKDMQADPVADDLASLGLDMLVAEAGWARHAPNPLLLVG